MRKKNDLLKSNTKRKVNIIMRTKHRESDSATIKSKENKKKKNNNNNSTKMLMRLCVYTEIKF
jgi:phage tail tube protein FII